MFHPTDEATNVCDRFGLTTEQILAALHVASFARAGGQWQPVLVDDLGQELADEAWTEAKRLGWYALADSHWGREIWEVTETGKEVLTPFVDIVKAKAN